MNKFQIQLKKFKMLLTKQISNDVIVLDGMTIEKISAFRML